MKSNYKRKLMLCVVGFIPVLFLLGSGFLPFNFYKNIAVRFLPINKVLSYRFEMLVFFLKAKSFLVALIYGVIACFACVFYKDYIRKQLKTVFNRDVFVIMKEYINFWRETLYYRNAFFWGVFVIYIVLRINVFGKHVSFDEVYSLYHYAIKPLFYGLTSYTLPNNHFVNTFFMHIFYKFFGISTITLKLPALICSMFFFVAFYISLRKIFSKTIAELGILFLSFSPIMITFSTFGRGYIYMLFFQSVAMYFLFEVIKGRRGAIFPYAVFSSLAFYSVPLFVIIFIALELYILYDCKEKCWDRTLKTTVLTLIITGILYLPVFIVSGFDMVSAHTRHQIIGWNNMKFGIMYFISLFKHISRNFYLPFGFFVFLFLVSLFILRKEKKYSLLCLSLFVFGFFYVSKGMLTFPYRTMIIFIPFFILVFSGALEKLILIGINKMVVYSLLLFFLTISYGAFSKETINKSYSYVFELDKSTIEWALHNINKGNKIWFYGRETIMFFGDINKINVLPYRGDCPKRGDLVIVDKVPSRTIKDVLTWNGACTCDVIAKKVFENKWTLIYKITDIK